VRELSGAITREGVTLVPMDIHFNERGVAKILLGIAEGKKKHDKRAAIAARDWQRDKARLMREKG
jgi:SsrA-binding protein